MSETTLHRWLQRPEFLDPYRHARLRIVEHALAQLQSVTAEAVDALTRNLNCGRPSNEIAAARITLELSLKAIEVVDLDERLASLEAYVSDRSSG